MKRVSLFLSHNLSSVCHTITHTKSFHAKPVTSDSGETFGKTIKWMIQYRTQDDSATGIPENPQWLAGLHRDSWTEEVREKYNNQGEAKEKRNV